jgi:hypothetical protein
VAIGRLLAKGKKLIRTFRASYTSKIFLLDEAFVFCAQVSVSVCKEDICRSIWEISSKFQKRSIEHTWKLMRWISEDKLLNASLRFVLYGLLFALSTFIRSVLSTALLRYRMLSSTNFERSSRVPINDGSLSLVKYSSVILCNSGNVNDMGEVKKTADALAGKSLSL